MAEPGRWMLYGANGYTGRLIIEEALKRGHRPLLAGRSAGPIEALAEETGLDHVVVDLGDPLALRESLSDIHTVLHAAGPFSATSQPMEAAALETGTHYLDITGEIAVYVLLLRVCFPWAVIEGVHNSIAVAIDVSRDTHCAI